MHMNDIDWVEYRIRHIPVYRTPTYLASCLCNGHESLLESIFHPILHIRHSLLNLLPLSHEVTLKSRRRRLVSRDMRGESIGESFQLLGGEIGRGCIWRRCFLDRG